MERINLDDPAAIRSADVQQMLVHVAALPEQCRGAWAVTQDLDLPAAYKSVDKVLVAGMGGSAIGADLAAAVVADHGAIPVLVYRDYDLPAWADRRTLVIASSYSGNTEETLSVFRAAHDRGCPLVALTTGGELADLADRYGAPHVSFDYPSMPRAALGYLFVSLLGILRALGAAQDIEVDLREALAVLAAQEPLLAPEAPRAQNRAKQLAEALLGRVPVVVAAEALAPVARRWKSQFNENSKGWAYFEILPEMNHNALSGIHYPATAVDHLSVLFLCQASLHPRNRLRLEATRKVFESRGAACHEVTISGQSKLAQILSAVHLGDYISCYLALLYGTDPTAIKDIHGLKWHMSGRI
jgi:glucose/mannose-6-phosphate isomerase